MKKIRIPQTREEWLQDRRTGIGGSDAGAVLGVNPYKSTYRLWLEKKGLISDEVPDNEAMWFGRQAEDMVAKRFEAETGKKVKRSNFSFQSEKHPFMLANVDRLVVGEKAGLECKTANFFADKEYQEGYIPQSYYAQCYHYMAVTGYEKWYLAVLVPGKSFHIYVIDRDEEQIQALIEAEQEFWSSLDGNQEPPAAYSDTDLLNRRYQESTEDSIEVFVDEKVERLNEVKAMIKDLDKEKKSIENQLRQELGEFEQGFTPAGTNIQWKPVTSYRLNTERLKTEEPEIYEDYLEPSTTRRLTVKKGKKK